MENFEFCVPTKYIFGQGVVEQVGATVKSYGYKKVLLVYGGGSVIKSGLLDKIKSQLKDEDIDYYEINEAFAAQFLALILSMKVLRSAKSMILSFYCL